jgi:hypothetical protein
MPSVLSPAIAPEAEPRNFGYSVPYDAWSRELSHGCELRCAWWRQGIHAVWTARQIAIVSLNTPMPAQSPF